MLSCQVLFQFGEEPASAVLIHGGGAGLVTCSDGSTFDTNISFTALSSNGTVVAGNWTMYSFDTGNADPYIQVISRSLSTRCLDIVLTGKI